MAYTSRTAPIPTNIRYNHNKLVDPLDAVTVLVVLVVLVGTGVVTGIVVGGAAVVGATVVGAAVVGAAVVGFVVGYTNPPYCTPYKAVCVLPDE